MSSPGESNLNETGVIYSSENERVLSLLFLGPCTLYTLVAQMLVLLTIIKSPNLHNVHFYMMGVSCCADASIVALSGPMFMQQFLTGTPTSRFLCDAVTILLPFIILGFIGQIGLTAYERYLFFCKPFRYQSLVTVKRMTVALVACYATSFVVIITSSLMYERQYHASVLLCDVSGVGVQDAIIFFVIVLPSAILTVYSMLRIYLLIKKARASENMSIPIHQSRKTLRMLLLLSGAYWGTIVPAGITRLILFHIGYTWHDLDTRRYLGPAVFNRLLIFLSCSASSAVNPLIYLYTRKDLRDAAKSLLLARPARQERNSDMHMITDSG